MYVNLMEEHETMDDDGHYGSCCSVRVLPW
jgi:hypothetical protein